MAQLSARPKIELQVNLQLNEQEVRALEALAGYGIEEFLKTFYKELGRTYLGPHEPGLRSLFDSVRLQLPAVLAQFDKAREAFR